MQQLKVGDKVIALTTSGNYKEGWVGTIVQVDNSGIPYRIKYENGALCWGVAEHFKLYDGCEQSSPKAALTHQTIELLKVSLGDDLGITKVKIEFDTGLVVTLKEKE